MDTDAFRSILPPSRHNNPTLQPSSAALVAANGTSIHTYGEQEVNIRLSGQTYIWTFIIADVRHPLLGADFLSHYSLVVDVARHRLLNTDTYTSVPLCISNVEENINLLSTDDTYSDIINDFDDVFKPELRLSPGAAAKHGVQHFIKTTGPPVHSRYRCLRPELHHIAKQAFTEMEKMGVCSKAATPWASPLHMTPKKDGTWRPCGDYRRLNLITEPDHYAMPNISDLTSSISTSRVFSKLDLLKGYFQVPVNPDDVPKTAITTPFGTYVFHYSTFSLRNSGATFQRMMDQIFGHLPYCKVYIDDILVASENHREHREHLRSVLELLHTNGLVIRRDKCVFGASTIDFLIHDISGDGVRPLPSKVDAVNKFPKPTTVKQLQEFLGMINYYHRFIPNAAEILSPLYRLSDTKQKELEGWTPDHEHAKEALVQAATLATPTSTDKLYLVTDASNIAIGAVLERCNDGHRQPLGFFSRQLTAPQRKYSTFGTNPLCTPQSATFGICSKEHHTPSVQTTSHWSPLSANTATLGPVGSNDIYQRLQKRAARLSIFLASRMQLPMHFHVLKSQQSNLESTMWNCVLRNNQTQKLMLPNLPSPISGGKLFSLVMFSYFVILVPGDPAPLCQNLSGGRFLT